MEIINYVSENYAKEIDKLILDEMRKEGIKFNKLTVEMYINSYNLFEGNPTLKGGEEFKLTFI